MTKTIKKILVLTLLATTLTACGSGSTANQTTDSLSAQVDTAAVSADSTTAQIPADSSVVK